MLRIGFTYIVFDVIYIIGTCIIGISAFSDQELQNDEQGLLQMQGKTYLNFILGENFFLYAIFGVLLAETVLYVVYTASLFYLRVNANRLSTGFSLLLAVLIEQLNFSGMLGAILYMSYAIVYMPGIAYFYIISFIFSLISLIWQASIIYTIYKLRSKIIAAASAIEAENSDATTTLLASA